MASCHDRHWEPANEELESTIEDTAWPPSCQGVDLVTSPELLRLLRSDVSSGIANTPIPRFSMETRAKTHCGGSDSDESPETAISSQPIVHQAPGDFDHRCPIPLDDFISPDEWTGPPDDS
jgi:hypothetical protein